MSSPRQLMSALWAALWLHGRLLALRLRRLFGRGPEAGDGPDFQLLGADVLAAEADRDPVELPAELTARLAALRADLIEHAQSAASPRTSPLGSGRRRAVALTVAAVLGLGVAGAGASALVSGTTGVPSVDRLLGIYEQNLNKPGAADRGGPSGSDLRPSASKAAEPIETVLSDGSKSVTTFYVAQDGRICWAAGGSDPDGSGTTSCESPPDVMNGVRGGLYVPAIDLGDSDVILRGFARGNVARVSGRGPDGPLDVHLGEPWTPAVQGEETLRPLVATGSVPRPGPAGSKEDPRFELERYTFEVITDDGRRIRIAP